MISLGIDLGTTKVASVLVDTDASRILATSGREHEAQTAGSRPWENTQDPEAILAAAEELLVEAQSAAEEADGRIEGISISGQMHGILYLDGAGSPLSPLFTWLDARGAQKHPEGVSYAEALSALTGYRIAPGFGSVTHFYNMTNGLVPSGMKSVCTILDYVTMRLCARKSPVSDATTAASLGLFDLASGSFDGDALRMAGFTSAELPRVVDAGSAVGRTPEGIPVFAPVADNQASFIGAVKEPEKSVLVNVGTAGQISRYSRSALSSSEEIDVRPYPGGGFLHVGAALCSGKAYEHLRRFFREVLGAFGADESAVSYEAINRLLESVDRDGPSALQVDTRFAGTRTDPTRSGSIANINLTNFTPARLASGFIEGITDELYGFFVTMTGAATPPDHVIASGNGLRTNDALRAAFERRFARPLELPLLREEAALGAALCAAVGAGAYPDFRSAGEIIRYET